MANHWQTHETEGEIPKAFSKCTEYNIALQAPLQLKKKHRFLQKEVQKQQKKQTNRPAC